ncbi:MAG: hypothetical protein ACJ8FZ_09805, partial [Bradyrhizobium sp.]
EHFPWLHPSRRHACAWLLRMRSETLMVRSALLGMRSETLMVRSALLSATLSYALTKDSQLLRMRSETLMVRSAAKPRVSNHEATDTRY